MSSIEYPTRPADLPFDVTLGTLVEHYHGHVGRLVDAQCGLGEPLAAEVLAAHAVAALAVQHALAERVLGTRWCNIRDALAYGSTVDAAAAACGLDPDELVFGLRSWADGQSREGLMTDLEHAGVLALLQARSAPAVRAVDGLTGPTGGEGAGRPYPTSRPHPKPPCAPTSAPTTPPSATGTGGTP